ncbi:c-type cytochrome [Pseudaminobacter sp. NGMCC 1.201702]|uniref:c-type cytochrome n=1 Tax=Pseudaminobacter sp. NGMCC 1.201702 TaxID=3391825 RepID=UPI0039EE4CA4
MSRKVVALGIMGALSGAAAPALIWLFRITKEGPAVVARGGYESDMPGFRDVLSDNEIRSVLAFIRSTWPEQERAYQAQMSRQEKEKAQ